MAYFPFMVDIKHMKCLVAGGGRIALHKIKILLEYGVGINVVSPEICDEIKQIVHNYGNIRLFEHEFGDGDVINPDINKCEISDNNGFNSNSRYVDFVIAATNSREINMYIADVCRKYKVPVNAVDIKEVSDFIFPAIIHSDDMVISVSTGGSSPAAAAHIKRRIAQDLPKHYGVLIKKLGEYRGYVLEKVDNIKDRKEIFERLFEYGDEHNAEISEEEVQKIVEKYIKNS